MITTLLIAAATAHAAVAPVASDQHAHAHAAVVSAAVTASAAQPIPPGGDSEATAEERASYRKLVRDIRKIDREYERLLSESIDEAKGSESGSVSLERQAELINLRDQRDRLLQRLQLLALRHGWDMPDFEAGTESGGGEGDEDRLTEKEQVFASAADEIRTRAASEARMIAQRISLPITPVFVAR